jgi:hypothetical protein
MRWHLAFLTLVVALAAAAVFTPTTSAAGSVCPSGGIPAPGSTVTGGLEVDSFCLLTNVTVKGGIIVDQSAAGFGLFMEGGTVFGGIVDNGGEVDALSIPGAPLTINGGLRLYNAQDFDILDGTIRGGFTSSGGFDCSPVGGPGCFAVPNFCGNTVYGNMTITGVSTGWVHIGDPELDEGCSGNTIHGSFSLSNSTVVCPVSLCGQPETNEFEGNTVTGSVSVNASTAEVYGNTIGGSLLCTNGTQIFPPLGLDPTGNAVRGANTCF